MALLNGQEMQLDGLSFAQIGEKLFEASPSKDGKGLRLELAEDEEQAFAKWGGLKIGLNIANVIGDAKRRAGQGSAPIEYKYDWTTRTFTT